MSSFKKRQCTRSVLIMQVMKVFVSQWVYLYDMFAKHSWFNVQIFNICISTVNEFFHLQKIHNSAIKNEEENVTLKTFTAHQKILYKKLITATCVKNHLKKTHKLKSLKIQKFILKEMMIINDIVKEILNVKRFAIYSILIIYCFVSIFNCSDIF